MSIDDLLRLRPSPEAAAAAPALARSRLVHVCLEAPPVTSAPTTSLRSVCALDLWTSTAAAAPPAALAELTRWLDRGATLALHDVASFGADRLIEEVYFPLFVRHAYCRGDAPFPMNLDTFRRLAVSDLPLAVASENGVVVAAGLFQDALRTPTASYSAPRLREDALDLVAFATREPLLDDAFFFACLEMLDAHEHRRVRVRRAPWITRGTLAAFRRDLARADQIAWEEREPRDYFFIDGEALAQHEVGLIVFERTAGGLRSVRLGNTQESLWSDVAGELLRLEQRAAS